MLSVFSQGPVRVYDTRNGNAIKYIHWPSPILCYLCSSDPHLLTTRKDYKRISCTSSLLDTWYFEDSGCDFATMSSSRRSSLSPLSPTQHHPQHRPRPPKTRKISRPKQHTIVTVVVIQATRNLAIV
ncbi:hypothetical protein M378DRAFT_168490 [Amanita muscaria Koide BX008]|uniref:Uncharacterized protein n=1 Tax=Amanita muscaria (strain Koide BX008) TaxID=946122 RepID=A0A0C2WTL5_AMAMK|nr:hypothetical protein M378DRAFT_168490 [Amanita muscaria Koide BX008]